MTTIPIVTFIGKANSGKTTFLEKFVAALSERGYAIATVKHHAHPTDVDGEQKDSWRHARAGAVVSMVSSPVQFSLFQQVTEEKTLAEIADEAMRRGCDILIAEGYKRQDYPKIELSRIERSAEALCAPEELEALITNNPTLAQAYGDKVSVFGLEEVGPFTDFFEQHFFKEQS